MIPGLENAEFARFGGIHKILLSKARFCSTARYALKAIPTFRFAGQITVCEGYIESAAVGLLCGYFSACQKQKRTPQLPPRTTALGSMLSHLIDDTDIDNYQPMNINFGIFPDHSRRKNGKRQIPQT